MTEPTDAGHDPFTPPSWHPSLLAALTDTEYNVLRGVAAGLDDKDIGAALFIAPTTVKCHLDAIRGKFDVHGPISRTQLMWLAVELGLVIPGWVRRCPKLDPEPIGRAVYPYQRSLARGLVLDPAAGRARGW